MEVSKKAVLSAIVVDLRELVEENGCDGLSTFSFRENMLDRNIPEQIAAFAVEYGKVILRVTQKEWRFFGGEADPKWEAEFRKAICVALDERRLCHSSVEVAIVSPVKPECVPIPV